MIINKQEFFAEFKKTFGRVWTTTKVVNLTEIINALEKYSNMAVNRKLEKWAYILATVAHETGWSFEPILENLNYSTAKRLTQVWPSRFPTLASAAPYVKAPKALAVKVYGGRLGNKSSADAYDFRGRGYVQITGRANAEKFSKIFGVDFVNNPELMNNAFYAAAILVYGSCEGTFTGISLSDYINEKRIDYYNARAVINGDVKANGTKIANIAVDFMEILKRSYQPGHAHF